MDINEEMKLRQWAQDMADQKASGLSQRKWCEMKGLRKNTFEYRCRRVRMVMEKNLEKTQTGEIVPVTREINDPVFAKVNINAPEYKASGINIKLNNAAVNIAPDTPAEHVRIVLEALVNA